MKKLITAYILLYIDGEKDDHAHSLGAPTVANEHVLCSLKQYRGSERNVYFMEGDEALEYMAKLASEGDESSFVALSDAMKTRLFRTAKGILDNDSLALEAVSEAVFRAYKGIRRLRQPQYAATWFMKILINAANDIYKRQKRETTLETVNLNTYYDDHCDLNFHQMIALLSIELREIVSLKYYSEFTLEEISHILQIPVGTVKSRLNRALKQLRVEVENESR